MATGRAASAAVALALVVAACQGSLTISPDSLPDGNVGQPYEQTIRVSGNSTPVADVSISNGALPSGITIEKQASDTATIAGTPTAAGTATFTISVSCVGMNFTGGQTAMKRYSLTIR